LVWFEQAGHESFHAHDPSLYQEAVSGLIQSATAPAGVDEAQGRQHPLPYAQSP
jgi:hypothetical protein